MNYLKTTFLLSLLTVFLVLLGGYFGRGNGALVALVIAGVMNLVSYWFSDKIVLAMYHAKEATQEDAPKLFGIVADLAMKSNMPMPRVYIIQSDQPNAFATGRSPKHASVAATTGILQLLSKEELEGVMAHELSHVRNRDTLIATIAATLAGAITWIAHMLQWGAFLGGGRDDDNRGGMAGALLMAILAPLAAMLVQMAISRSREFAADESGARLSGKPLALASALQRLESSVPRFPMGMGSPSTAHLFIVNPFRGGIAGLFSTHPSMEKRIARLQELATKI
jgi:heat shock protein HtpX